MSLPEVTKQQVEEVLSGYCEQKIPPHIRNQVRVWHIYYGAEPTSDFESLLQEVDDDPTGIFWG